MIEKKLKPPKSKKWARRRGLKIRLTNSTTQRRYPCFKLTWDQYELIYAAASTLGMSTTDFIAYSIEKAIERYCRAE